MSTKWTAADIPDQSGRVAVITGANTGLGYWTAEMLADKGAQVVLAVRNLDKGKDAVDRIKAKSPAADIALQQLDLTSLDDIRKATEELKAAHERIDLLINNAGVMYTDKATTKDGFELQFGTNHLGHFALTGLLLDALAAAREARVVSLSSITHKTARLDFDDLMSERDYRAAPAYGRSKLATTVFGLELDRRLRATGSPIASVLAHPGLTRTNLTPRAWEHRGRLGQVIARLGLVVTQSVERGALPQLRAATEPGVPGGRFYGPAGLWETRGRVAAARLGAQAADPAVGRRLWAEAERLTGVGYL